MTADAGQPKLILLDGSKGAGKTTAGELLAEQFAITFLSLDNERRALADPTGSRAERNKKAFEILLDKGAALLGGGEHLIIDCGLTPERIERLEKLSADTPAQMYRFLLRAPYATQLERVRARDESKGHPTDEERFAEVHAIVHAKGSDGAIVIDTEYLESPAVAAEIARKAGL